MTKRASPVDLRKALELANLFIQAGVNFVPVPVTSEEEQQALALQSYAKLEEILREIDRAPAQGAEAQEAQP